MNFARRYRNSQMLFGISLLLLVGFLLVWLKYVYQDKVADLETEVSYLWIKAIKEVETKDFTKLIITTFSENADFSTCDSTAPVDLGLNTSSFSLDNSDGKHFKTEYMFNSLDEGREVQIIMDSASSLLSHALTFSDSNSIDMNVSINAGMNKNQAAAFATGIQGNIENTLAQFALDIERVRIKLNSSLTKAKIPIQYAIRSIQDSVSHNHSNDKFYTQTAVGSDYTLELSEYKNYVLQNMWFEFCMALLLLIVIVSAFYYILHSLKEQHQLVQIKNDLISNITHELRTPIFTVSAALEALESFNGLENPERTKEYLSISKNELNRLSILVEKVLKTSLFEQSAMQLSKETFQLNSLVETIANSFKLQLENVQASLDIEAASGAVYLYADKIHITNVIYNLIDNALKYKAAHPLRIQIHLEELDQAVQITVSDNGIGIPDEYLAKIFTKFFRVPQGNQHNVKGYGLGLNYVSNIIQQHLGSIVAKSKAEQGTSFKITLPKEKDVVS